MINHDRLIMLSVKEKAALLCGFCRACKVCCNCPLYNDDCPGSTDLIAWEKWLKAEVGA